VKENESTNKLIAVEMCTLPVKYTYFLCDFAYISVLDVRLLQIRIYCGLLQMLRS